jgi:hypothetical protein
MTDAFPAIPPDGPLAPIRARREALESAAADLEHSLAAASAAPAWRDGVQTALGAVGEAMQMHLAGVDADEGVPASVVHAEPRLSGPAARLNDEHVELTARLMAVTGVAGDSSAAPDEVQAAGAQLVVQLRSHVHHAHDLLYDALESELGGGD